VQSWIVALLVALTLGILAVSPADAQDPPWGWWDDADSIARPLAEEDFLGGAHGRIRLAAASGAYGGPTRRSWDAATSKGPLRIEGAGRCDSQCIGTRQRVSWAGRRLKIKVGDLGARPEEALLEDAAEVSDRPSPLLVLGSGKSSAGVDAEAEFPDMFPWEARVHSRVASAAKGGTRGDLLGSVGILRAGAAFGDARGGTVLPLGGIALETSSTALEASHLGNPGEGSWRLALRSTGPDLRQEWTITHRAPAKETGSAGRDEAVSRIAWNRDGTRLAWEGLARSDSAARTDLRAMAGLSQDLAGVTLRIRSRWNGGDGPTSSSLTPGIRRAAGRFRPWAECAWSTSGESRPSAGFAWIEGAWRLETSTTRREDGAWDWASSSALSGRSSTLEVRVAQRNSDLEGGGTWSWGW
jgi:hypothetical protein